MQQYEIAGFLKLISKRPQWLGEMLLGDYGRETEGEKPALFHCPVLPAISSAGKPHKRVLMWKTPPCLISVVLAEISKEDGDIKY